MCYINQLDLDLDGLTQIIFWASELFLAKYSELHLANTKSVLKKSSSGILIPTFPLTCSTRYSGPVLNQHALGSLHHRGLLHVDGTERQSHLVSEKFANIQIFKNRTHFP